MLCPAYFQYYVTMPESQKIQDLVNFWSEDQKRIAEKSSAEESTIFLVQLEFQLKSLTSKMWLIYKL